MMSPDGAFGIVPRAKPRGCYYDVAPMGLLGLYPERSRGVDFLSHLLFQDYDILHFPYRNKHNSSRTDS
jgi:hypothetical protein